MIKLQDKQFGITNPIEIDKAVEYMRLAFKSLSWISHPFHIAEKFPKEVNGRTLVYPEIYYKDAGVKKYQYHRLTPDNDYTGLVFFVLDEENTDTSDFNSSTNLTYKVGIIFSVNLSKIDEVKLQSYKFTQELIREARNKLRSLSMEVDFKIKIGRISKDVSEVYREFILDDLEHYNRLPLQVFRIDVEIEINDDCSLYEQSGICDGCTGDECEFIIIHNS